ncbi:hypothetical protein ACVWW1_003215 [Bradyrhizobium sp. JR3.5]
MRFLALWLILFAAPQFAYADDTILKVGVTTRDFVPAEPYDWRGAATHALRVMIWYPAVAEAREQPQSIGPRLIPFARAGRAAPDAAPAVGPRRPLVLLSHGFGGTASDLAWLGVGLAAHGFIAVAVNHPGNNQLEDYTVEGFALMWLRAVDLSAIIDAMRADETFGDRITRRGSALPATRSAATRCLRSQAASPIRRGRRRSAAHPLPTRCARRKRASRTCAGRASCASVPIPTSGNATALPAIPIAMSAFALFLPWRRDRDRP